MLKRLFWPAIDTEPSAVVTCGDSDAKSRMLRDTVGNDEISVSGIVVAVPVRDRLNTGLRSIVTRSGSSWTAVCSSAKSTRCVWFSVRRTFSRCSSL